MVIALVLVGLMGVLGPTHAVRVMPVATPYGPPGQLSGGAAPSGYARHLDDAPLPPGPGDQASGVADTGASHAEASDGNGCQAAAGVAAGTAGGAPVVDLATPFYLTSERASVTVAASVTGGATPYTYRWSTGATTPTITVTSSGHYALTVKGADGCAAEAAVEVYQAALELTKVGPDEPVRLGETINYSLVVSNTGEATLTQVIVRDPMLDIEHTIPSLAAGASQSVAGTYVVTGADVPANLSVGARTFTLLNKATASSAEAPGAEASWAVLVDSDAQAPLAALAIAKMGPAAVNIGEVIDYEILVTNTGEVVLTDVHIVDAKLGLDTTVPSLAVGASQAVNGSYGPVTEAHLPGPVVNTAVASSAEAEPVEATWSVEIRWQPSLAITKTGPAKAVVLGETITYHIAVRNNGDVALHNVRVVDSRIGLDECIAVLPAGELRQFTGTYTVGEDDLSADLQLSSAAVASSDEAGPVEARWDVPIAHVLDPASDAPCAHSEVAVVIYGGWNGIPVRAWVGDAEQPTLYTETNRSGESQVVWTFYPPEGTTWSASVQPVLPEGLDPERWGFTALGSTAVSFGRCEERVIYLQLTDQDEADPTPVPQAPILPKTDGAGLPRMASVLVRLVGLALLMIGAYLVLRRRTLRGAGGWWNRAYGGDPVQRRRAPTRVPVSAPRAGAPQARVMPALEPPSAEESV